MSSLPRLLPSKPLQNNLSRLFSLLAVAPTPNVKKSGEENEPSKLSHVSSPKEESPSLSFVSRRRSENNEFKAAVNSSIEILKQKNIEENNFINVDGIRFEIVIETGETNQIKLKREEANGEIVQALVTFYAHKPHISRRGPYVISKGDVFFDVKVEHDGQAVCKFSHLSKHNPAHGAPWCATGIPYYIVKYAETKGFNESMFKWARNYLSERHARQQQLAWFKTVKTFVDH